MKQVPPTPTPPFPRSHTVLRVGIRNGGPTQRVVSSRVPEITIWVCVCGGAHILGVPQSLAEPLGSRFYLCFLMFTLGVPPRTGALPFVPGALGGLALLEEAAVKPSPQHDWQSLAHRGRPGHSNQAVMGSDGHFSTGQWPAWCPQHDMSLRRGPISSCS